MGGLSEQVLRFAHYASLLGLFGWTAFRLVRLRGLDWVSPDTGKAALIFIAICAPLLSIALMVVSIAAMMGAPIASLDWPMVEAMIVDTDMGTGFLIRLVLLVAGLGALMASRAGKSGRLIAVICFAGAVLTLSWSGHAAATEGGLGLFHRLNNGIHLLSASLWLGAVFWFLLLTVKAHRQPDVIHPIPLLRVMHAFAPLGVGLVATVAITGLINGQLIFGLDDSLPVLATPYGVLLTTKVVLVGGMLAFGAHNARIGRQAALNGESERLAPSVTLSRLRRSLAGEFMSAVGVIGLVAVLGMMSPMIM